MIRSQKKGDIKHLIQVAKHCHQMVISAQWMIGELFSWKRINNDLVLKHLWECYENILDDDDINVDEKEEQNEEQDINNIPGPLFHLHLIFNSAWILLRKNDLSITPLLSFVGQGMEKGLMKSFPVKKNYLYLLQKNIDYLAQVLERLSVPCPAVQLSAPSPLSKQTTVLEQNQEEEVNEYDDPIFDEAIASASMPGDYAQDPKAAEKGLALIMDRLDKGLRIPLQRLLSQLEMKISATAIQFEMPLLQSLARIYSFMLLLMEHQRQPLTHPNVNWKIIASHFAMKTMTCRRSKTLNLSFLRNCHVSSSFFVLLLQGCGWSAIQSLFQSTNTLAERIQMIRSIIGVWIIHSFNEQVFCNEIWWDQWIEFTKFMCYFFPSDPTLPSPLIPYVFTMPASTANLGEELNSFTFGSSFPQTNFNVKMFELSFDQRYHWHITTFEQVCQCYHRILTKGKQKDSNFVELKRLVIGKENGIFGLLFESISSSLKRIRNRFENQQKKRQDWNHITTMIGLRIQQEQSRDVHYFHQRANIFNHFVTDQPALQHTVYYLCFVYHSIGIIFFYFGVLATNETIFLRFLNDYFPSATHPEFPTAALKLGKTRDQFTGIGRRQSHFQHTISRTLSSSSFQRKKQRQEARHQHHSDRDDTASFDSLVEMLRKTQEIQHYPGLLRWFAQVSICALSNILKSIIH